VTVSALYNGVATAAVPVTERGLSYGDGLFETIKVMNGRAQFLAWHRQRLRRDCERLALALDDAALAAEIARILHGQNDGVLKVIVTRAAGGRGYQPLRGAAANRLVLFYAEPRPVAAGAALSAAVAPGVKGVRVRVCRQRLAEQPALAGMKPLNRLEQVLARAEWSDPDIAEGLMLDQHARLIEATASNLFLVRGDRLLTPRLQRCGVAGVMRRVVMEQLLPAGRVEEVDLTLDDLIAADEVFLTNSLTGIRPVTQIDCLHKCCGDATIALWRSLSRLINHEAR
jgi:4-amino-4-deoxychorismate lyase